MRKLSLILAITLIFVSIGCVFPGVAFADVSQPNVGMTDPKPEIEYSDVLADLQKDERFDVSEYPTIPYDYSLQVITVAESVNDELFVYVYQPSGEEADLRATSIEIAKGYKTLAFKIYTLTLCNSNKTLYKYKVDNFEVDDIRLRYYDITSIYRAWSKDYGDKEAVGNNTISEVAFKVARVFKLGVENNEVVADSIPTDTITVVSEYVGFVRYVGGFLWQTDACDSHFVAFSTDIPIDKLREADIYYRSQLYTYDSSNLFHPDSFGEIVDNYSYVKDTQEIQYESSGHWNVGTICRDRIQTINEFIASENFENVYSYGLFNSKAQSPLTQEGKNNLKDCEWVIRFAETRYFYDSQMSPPYITRREYYIVSDVTILRLEGISDGNEFNLGVVDNKQSGTPNDPDNDFTYGDEFNTDWFDDFQKQWKQFVEGWDAFWKSFGDFFKRVGVWIRDNMWLVWAIAGLVGLGILSIFWRPIRVFFKLIFKGLWFLLTVVTLARPIVSIVYAIKERSGSGGK